MTTPLTHTFDLTKFLSGPYYCTGCAGRVCEEVLSVEGVSAAECDLEAGGLSITYDPGVLHLRDLESVIGRIALAAEDRVMHATYRVTGLD